MRLLLLLALTLGAGCRSIQPPEKDDDTPQGPSDWRVPRNMFREIIKHLQRGDRPGAEKILDSLLLTEAETLELFGPEVGPRVWAGYRDEIVPDLKKEAINLLAAKVAEGYTDVEVDRIGPARPELTTPGGMKMLEALQQKRAMFNVRIKRPDGALGLRFDGFTFIHGHYRALLKAYLYVDPPPPPDAGAPPDAGPPAADDGGAPAAADAGAPAP